MAISCAAVGRIGRRLYPCICQMADFTRVSRNGEAATSMCATPCFTLLSPLLLIERETTDRTCKSCRLHNSYSPLLRVESVSFWKSTTTCYVGGTSLAADICPHAGIRTGRAGIGPRPQHTEQTSSCTPPSASNVSWPLAVHLVGLVNGMVEHPDVVFAIEVELTQ